MAQDLNTVLQKLQELTQASKEPGRLSPEQLEAEVKKVTGMLQETLANLSTQLLPGASPETAFLLEAFQTQIRTLMEQSGMVFEKTEETENLSQDLDLIKRGSIRT